MIPRKYLGMLPEGVKAPAKRVIGKIPRSWRQGLTYWRWRKFLCDAQGWPRERIDAWQLDQLRRIIKHAYEKTEGYRDLFKRAGVCPDDIRSLEDVSSLPFTSKELFRDHLEAFSVKTRNRIYTTTGGSTGIPFGFYNSRENRLIEDAFIHSSWIEAGWRLGECNAVLRGAYTGSEDNPWFFDPLRNELNLSSYYLSSRTIRVYVDALNRFRPKFIQAYPSSLDMFCDLLREAGLSGRISFALVLLGSENIYDWQMEKFRSELTGARLFSWYGHTEKAIFAPWCGLADKYHVQPFYGVTEILGGDGNPVIEGGGGELVGTSFHNQITPFIRYRTMDIAVKGSSLCASCARPFPILEKIIGRNQEFLVTKMGHYIPITSLNIHDDILDGVRQFQFFQEQKGLIVFKYIPKKVLSEKEINRIRYGLEKKAGENVDIILAAVDEIPRTKTGKFRLLDQRLSISYGDRS